MKNFFVLLLLSAVAFAGCKVDNATDINGTYQRLYLFQDQEYQVELSLTTDGQLHWRPLDSIPGHQSSTVKYVLQSGKQFKIYEDTDCNSEAIYDYVISNEQLSLSSASDSCQNRKMALSGDWTKVK
ncbi:MAG: hypothetical protein IT219_09300 [Bacteroidales bacterium]|nr:hypothetical protein [Bacteroidales bacterium]